MRLEFEFEFELGERTNVNQTFEIGLYFGTRFIPPGPTVRMTSKIEICRCAGLEFIYFNPLVNYVNV